jgi:phosphatidate cytidylyltransferase
MKNRLLVAAIGVPLLYLVIYSDFREHIALALAVSAACTIAALELTVMLRPMGPWVPASFVPVLLSPLFAWKLSEVGIFLAMLSAIPLLLAFQGLSVQREQPLHAITATMLPVAWIAPAAGLLVILRQAEAGFDLVILLIASVFLNDAGAYFTGRAFGRHKLSPRISPNKSIEGFVGGVVIGTAVMWYGHFIVEAGGVHVLNGWEALGTGLAVSFATPLGDLFESLVKRASGVKDSGNVLGEHGGLLDRVDALLFAIPVFYVGCFYAGAL